MGRHAFGRGFVAVLPLWPGVVPFAIAFAVLARTAGFTIIQTQALSVLVFAGAAQVAIVTLTAGGSAGVVIVLTAFLLNLRHVLYSLSLNSILGKRTRPPRGVLAFVLTDEVYGLTVKAHLDGQNRGHEGTFLFGAGTSLYISFNIATLVGSVLGSLIPDPTRIGLDFIFPLTFLVLLLPLIRSSHQLLVAAISGIIALILSRFLSGGVTILVSAIVAATLGAILDGRSVPSTQQVDGGEELESEKRPDRPRDVSSVEIADG